MKRVTKLKRLDQYRVTVRLTADERRRLESLSAHRLESLSTYIRNVALAAGSRAPAAGDNYRQPDRDQLLDDLTFLFSFFQRNAPNLDMENGDVEILQGIFTRVKEMTDK